MDATEKLRIKLEKEIKSKLRKSLEVAVVTHTKYYQESKNDIQLGIIEGLKSAIKIIK